MASLLRSVFNSKPNQPFFTSRFLSRTPGRFADKVIEESMLNGKTHKVSNLEKRILVWAGKFKSVQEVPSLLEPEVIERATSRARIRIVNYMMVATAFACLFVVISGKKAHERGDSVQTANLEWHRRINEQADKEEKKPH